MLSGRGKLNNRAALVRVMLGPGSITSGQLPEDDFTDSLSVSPSVDVFGVSDLAFCWN